MQKNLAKFLILFCAPEPMSSFMNRSTAEERRSGLEAWTNWFNSIDKNIKFRTKVLEILFFELLTKVDCND